MASRSDERDVSDPEEQSKSDQSDTERRKYYISQALFESLEGKGYSDNAIKKSIVAGCVDESTCEQWLQMHVGHAELDTPLEDGVEVVVKMKRILTEAERAAKVQELRAKARAKMEDEKRQAQEEERKRIAVGRKALETKELLDKIRRDTELEAVRRQKQQDLAARRKVRVQILTDKFVREGLKPGEARQKAEEQIEEEARKKREEVLALAGMPQLRQSVSEAEDSSSAWNLRSFTAPAAVPLDEVFTNESSIRSSSIPELASAIANFGDPAVAQQCLKVLRTILINIRSSPFDISKRLLKTSTNTFATKLAPVRPALQLLRVCGFRLATDSNGGEVITAATVVLRVVNRALEALSGCA